MADLLIKNGLLASELDVVEASIAITDGKVSAIGAAADMPAASEVVDASGLHILPGVIDVHVHFREPGMDHKEDWHTGTMAAAKGGVTTVFEMPNTAPPVSDVARFEKKRALASSKALVDFGLYGVIMDDNLGDLAPMADAGVIGYKLFLGNTTGNLPCPSDGAVLEAFEIIAKLGKRVSIHAENSPILFWREARLKAAGRAGAIDHLMSRTDVVALEALSRSCVFAEWTGARIHIVHESCARSVPYIKFFKERGVDLTVETLPQYLTLAIEDADGPMGNIMRMNPPIRERWQQGPLMDALNGGLIDMISTDHAPHLPSEKDKADIWDAACGFPGLESQLPIMLSLVNEGAMSLPRYVQVSSANAARAFGLYGQKGVLQPGADADIVLVDMRADWRLSAAALASKGKVSPFEGRRVTARPVATFVRGAMVMREGAITGEAGTGRPVRQVMPPPAPRNVDTHLSNLCGASPAPA
ncbi:MAG: dihydroorotase [Pseudomonadota bacterium]